MLVSQPGAPTAATIHGGLQADAFQTLSHGLGTGTWGPMWSGCVLLGQWLCGPTVCSCTCPMHTQGRCDHGADARMYYNSASSLAAELWRAHARGVAHLSTPLPYTKMHTQTNGRHCSPSTRVPESPCIPGNYTSQAPLPFDFRVCSTGGTGT